MNAQQKTVKYDRQLRLWGNNGQQRLESSSVLLLGVSHTGCEALKNLILPGIGSVCVMDDKLVQKEDVERNFFLSKDDINLPFAKQCLKSLSELNEEVKTSFELVDPQIAIREHINSFANFSLVIAGIPLHENDLCILSDFCRSKRIPLVVTRSFGFFAYVRIDIDDHTVIESHPDQEIVDLRLDAPIPGLLEFAMEYDLKNETSHVLSHIPYPLILLNFVSQWKAQGRQFPPTQSERRNFADSIKELSCKLADSENIEEALKFQNLNQLYNGSKIPDKISQLLALENLEFQAAESDFWLLIMALKEFVANEGGGRLPISGKVPDMKADTNSFVRLQKLFKTQANEDLKLMKRYADTIAKDLHREPVHDEILGNFCKNILNLKSFSGKGIRHEFSEVNGALIAEINQSDDSDELYYVFFRALDRFYKENNNRYPEMEDRISFAGYVQKLSKSLGITHDNMENQIVNFLKAGSQELPTIAALMGGIVSQEVIKLLTNQYEILNNALVFNGISSTSSVLQL